MDWFLYDIDLRHERVKISVRRAFTKGNMVIALKKLI